MADDLTTKPVQKYEGASELEAALGASTIESNVAALAGAAVGVAAGAAMGKSKLMGGAVGAIAGSLAGGVHGYFKGRDHAKRGQQQFTELTAENSGLKAEVAGYRAAEDARRQALVTEKGRG